MTCLICESPIDAPSEHQEDARIMAFEERKAEEAKDQQRKAEEAKDQQRKAEEAKDQQYKAEIAALQAERAELRAAITELNRESVVSTSDFDRYVEVAAKGMAERDSYPMPESVTTPEAFYKIMAAAALEAIGPRALPGVTSAHRGKPERTQEPRRRPDANSKRVRHRRLFGKSKRRRTR
jgi:hypothetical protein